MFYQEALSHLLTLHLFFFLPDDNLKHNEFLPPIKRALRKLNIYFILTNIIHYCIVIISVMIIVIKHIYLLKLREGRNTMATLKYSRQRESIKEFLRNRTDHPTADVVYENMKLIYPNISLGTVYRNL